MMTCRAAESLTEPSAYLQDTRQQLQATHQQLEAELQDLSTQISGLEVRLAAEPAKQRAFALQVYYLPRIPCSVQLGSTCL